MPLSADRHRTASPIPDNTLPADSQSSAPLLEIERWGFLDNSRGFCLPICRTRGICRVVDGACAPARSSSIIKRPATEETFCLSLSVGDPSSQARSGEMKLADNPILDMRRTYRLDPPHRLAVKPVVQRCCAAPLASSRTLRPATRASRSWRTRSISPRTILTCLQAAVLSPSTAPRNASSPSRHVLEE